MKKLHLSYFFVCVFLCIVPFVSSTIILNEIMYNPTSCSDTYCEWIELYNPTNESINLTGWNICENTILAGFVNKTDREVYIDEGLLLGPYSFAIVTDGGSGTDVYSMFNVSNNSLALHVDASALCGGLSDTADTITLKTNELILIDIFEYNDDFGGDGNNASLERRDDSSIGESIIKSGTPGFKNSIATFTEEYSVLHITEFLPDPTGGMMQ